jgi:hypothetical protein
LPVWYKEKDVTGRGVGNRDERISRTSKSRTQRLGAWFLSAPLGTEDPASKQLRVELRQLADDATNHRMLVVPSIYREPEDFDERGARLNNMSVDQFIQNKIAQDHAA